MEYRRLGRTELRVSAVGAGTCQLRLVPERQAIDTLLKSFSLGVNIVHTAPDYGNAEDLIAKALRETDAKVIVASQGFDLPGNSQGRVTHFERLFEAACERFGANNRLDLYGIACIDDREQYGENVWGRHGMIAFLQEMKARGRLGGTFCTTHGSPEYVSRLVTSGTIDAVMMAYNPLGYHLLTYPPPKDRPVESIPRNQQEIFPLCREYDVGIMVMKPLAGGLLCASKAFPPRHEWHHARTAPTARDILRSILVDPGVACVVPGTASVEEAEENARSGHAPIAVTDTTQSRLTKVVEELTTSVCSRCGDCDTLCSQKLPVSSIFWAGLFHLHPSGVLEQPDNIEYFRQHPSLESICATCPDVTCVCPSGIDIPRTLASMHTQMVGLLREGLIAPPESQPGPILGDAGFGARIVSKDIPTVMTAGRTYLCRLQLENAGERGWLPHHPAHQARVALGVFVNQRRTQMLDVTQDVHRGGRWHFVFEVTPPAQARRFQVRLRLLGEHLRFAERLAPLLLTQEITVEGPPGSSDMRWIDCGTRRLKRLAARALGRTPAAAAAPVSYGATWLEHNLPESYRKGEVYQLYLRVENRGPRPWPAHHPEGRWVEVVVYIEGALHRTARIPHDVAPGQRVLLTMPVTFPAEADAGKWTLTISFLEQQVAWCHEQGLEPLVVEVRAEEPEAGALAEACAIARDANWGMWQPSGGLLRSRTGRRYPTFIEQAQGCRLRDPDGHEWIDYVMAGGAAVLGYAHPEVQAAIARELSSSAVVSLAHMLEIKVTQLLCTMIPCAEMVLFGKHGSDMCTAAIRTARLHTGRRTVLYSGYHGWHDWYAETLQPRLKDQAEALTLFRFDLNDVSSFDALVQAHRGQIAAVILEPAAQAATLDGPTLEADRVFLRHVAEVCEQQRCVLIFDEIVTGFRYPQGSVQQATGVIPDLACFGKALSGGMPLAALVGRRRVMQTALQAAYMPTFRGEVYSLAAAAAALQIHQREDVPAKVQAIGTALKDAINQLSRELNVRGEMIGVPFRMIYRFDDPDMQQRVLMRTLLQQELLQRGVLTYKGFMLPSLAHDAADLDQTVSAFRGALTRVQEVAASGTFVRHLEIPLI